MKQILSWRPTRKQTLALSGTIAALGIVFVFIGGYYFGWSWTGLGSYSVPKSDTVEFHPAKTLWDWMQLLIVPAVLAGGAYLLNQRNAETQNRVAADNQRDAALQTYIDNMSELLLEKGLRESKEDGEIRNVARTRTLTVSRRLDGDRKGILLQFLKAAKLISKGDADQSKTIIALIGVDLTDAFLVGADLSGTNLVGADLSRADLRAADLSRAYLHPTILGGAFMRGANLSGADLSGSYLVDADLRETDLSGANLSGVFLTGAKVSGANLRGADLSTADLTGANLVGVDLSGANLSGAFIESEQLGQAASLKGAILPDGSKHD